MALGAIVLAGCRTAALRTKAAPQTDDEMVVAGQRFHTGTRVIIWTDPAGYNAYQPGPPRAYGLRQFASLPGKSEREPVRSGLAALQECVDQFVLHYDGCGLSRICFDLLQRRALSVHFLLDVDGTVYQTLDLQERALHATTANDRSIGIEIANIGAYPPGETKALDEWYQNDAQGQTGLKVPQEVGDPGSHTKNFTGRPARPALVRGVVQGKDLVQYDYTPEQYAALIRLTAALCRVFPRIKGDCPRDASGRLVLQKLPDDKLAKYEGILGHFHIQTNKDDPGPAFQWEKLIAGLRQLTK